MVRIFFSVCLLDQQQKILRVLIDFRMGFGCPVIQSHALQLRRGAGPFFQFRLALYCDIHIAGEGVTD